MFTAEGVFGLPAYPTADVVDPTGAGDTFAGGFMGYVAAHPDEELNDELLRRAMAYGTALASFNVEAFGTERMPTLTATRSRNGYGAPADHAFHRGAGRAAGLTIGGFRLTPARRDPVPSRVVTWGFLSFMLALKIPLAG